MWVLISLSPRERVWAELLWALHLLTNWSNTSSNDTASHSIVISLPPVLTLETCPTKPAGNLLVCLVVTILSPVFGMTFEGVLDAR